MALVIVPPLVYSGSIMSYVEPMDWVVMPRSKSTDDILNYYGCRAISGSHQLFIASGCCAAVMVRSTATPYNSMCSKCRYEFPIADNRDHPGEDDPFILSWGKFTWGEVETQMTKWLDYYFYLSGQGTVQINFDGKTWKDYIDD